MNKVRGSASEAVADSADGASLAVGGFGLSGVPAALIDTLYAQGATGLEAVSDNCGVDGRGLGVLLATCRIARVSGSYVGENNDLGVMDVTEDGLTLVETAPGVTVEEITARTGAPLDRTPTACR
ncbi:CoA-transferase [Streptomyces flaveolus]|uniref:CoA-transferase n=1 Tax=Streptomyces flaveolus TaxID=67297 RepID=UPI003681F2AC